MAAPLLLVTGAGGFVGRHVLAQAETAGWRTVRFAGDVLDPAAWNAAPGGVTAVIHLAAVLCRSRMIAPEDAARVERVNVEGTAAACRFCAARGARLVFASTAGVYASSPAPLAETAPTAPANAYARSKLAAEDICRENARLQGLTGVIARLFNVYGPFQSGPMLLPTVLEALLAGLPVSLRAPLSLRDHIHVSDVAAGLLAAAALDRPELTLLNLGAGRGVTNADFARLTAAVWERPLTLSIPQNVHASDSYVADAARTRALLGVPPALGLEEGLRLTRRAMA